MLRAEQPALMCEYQHPPTQRGSWPSRARRRPGATPGARGQGDLRSGCPRSTTSGMPMASTAASAHELHRPTAGLRKGRGRRCGSVDGQRSCCERWARPASAARSPTGKGRAECAQRKGPPFRPALRSRRRAAGSVCVRGAVVMRCVCLGLLLRLCSLGIMVGDVDRQHESKCGQHDRDHKECVHCCSPESKAAPVKNSTRAPATAATARSAVRV